MSALRVTALGAALLIATVIALLLVRHGVRARGGGRGRLTPRGPFLEWIPGLPSMVAGHGARSFLALLVPVGVILLPRSTSLGYRLPWGFDPGASLVWVSCFVLLALFLGGRWLFRRLELTDVG
jgi:hypothetical protein